MAHVDVDPRRVRACIEHEWLPRVAHVLPAIDWATVASDDVMIDIAPKDCNEVEAREAISAMICLVQHCSRFKADSNHGYAFTDKDGWHYTLHIGLRLYEEDAAAAAAADNNVDPCLVQRIMPVLQAAYRAASLARENRLRAANDLQLLLQTDTAAPAADDVNVRPDAAFLDAEEQQFPTFRPHVVRPFDRRPNKLAACIGINDWTGALLQELSAPNYNHTRFVRMLDFFWPIAMPRMYGDPTWGYNIVRHAIEAGRGDAVTILLVRHPASIVYDGKLYAVDTPDSLVRYDYLRRIADVSLVFSNTDLVRMLQALVQQCARDDNRPPVSLRQVAFPRGVVTREYSAPLQQLCHTLALTANVELTQWLLAQDESLVRQHLDWTSPDEPTNNALNMCCVLERRLHAMEAVGDDAETNRTRMLLRVIHHADGGM